MSNKIVIAALCLILSVPAMSWAGGFCCQMNQGVSEESASGDVSLRLDYSFSHMSKFVEGGDYVNLSTVQDDPRFRRMRGVVPVTMDMVRYTLYGVYNVTPKLKVAASIPYVVNDMTMAMFMGGMWHNMKMGTVRDLGDCTVQGAYRVYEDREPMPTTAAYVGVGLKTPTGSATVDENGKRIHAHMQPGTGSWDPYFTASFMKMVSPALLVSADARYEIATENGLGYSFGDTFSVNGNVKYNPFDFLNLGVNVNYFHSGQSDDPRNNYNGLNSRRLTDFNGYTGEDSIWVAPTVQLLLFKGFSADFKYQIPVYYHTPDIGFVTDYRAVAGISYSF